MQSHWQASWALFLALRPLCVFVAMLGCSAKSLIEFVLDARCVSIALGAVMQFDLSEDDPDRNVTFSSAYQWSSSSSRHSREKDTHDDASIDTALVCSSIHSVPSLSITICMFLVHADHHQKSTNHAIGFLLARANGSNCRISFMIDRGSLLFIWINTFTCRSKKLIELRFSCRWLLVWVASKGSNVQHASMWIPSNDMLLNTTDGNRFPMTDLNFLH